MKVLFCDIDGVLCPHGSCRSVSMNAEEITRSVIEVTGNDAYAYLDPRDVAAVALDWDPRSAAILRGVLERTGAALVVESDWRDGLDADLPDSTTDINDPRNYGELSSGSYTYDKQENRILERRNEKCDIRLLPYYDPLHKILGYQFQFFNYGGNAIVDKKYNRNVFLSSITLGYTLQFIALSESQTSERWDNKEYDSIYGTFAKATISTTLGQNPQTGLYDNREWNNVLVTPLSYKFLTGSKENNDGGVILVHFVGNKMNGAMEDWVLFYADNATWQIVHDAPNSIIYQPTF